MGLMSEEMNFNRALNGAEPANNAIAAGAIDFNALRLSQDYAQVAGVEKLLTTVPVRKPDKREFVRVHPDMHFETMLLNWEDKESYLVSPNLLTEVSGIAVPVSLKVAINRVNVLFLWPLRLPGQDGRSNAWHESAWEAAGLAVNRWVSVRAKMELGAYEIHIAPEPLSEPQWPDKSIEDLLNVAFRSRFIGDPEHPVIKRLQGRA